MRRLLIGVVVGVAAVIAVTPALAHGPVGAEPGPGSTVGGEIDEIAIVFPEIMTGEDLFIVVTGPDGAEVPAVEAARLDRDQQVARVAITPLTEPGQYRVDYRVAGVDGVTTPGAYVFTYQEGAEPPDPVPVPEPVLTTSSGPNWTAFGLGLVVAGAILFVSAWNARRRA